MTTYIGIDPGFKGAIAVIKTNDTIRVVDVPAGVIGKAKKEYFIPQMVEILQGLMDQEAKGNCVVAIEKVHSMPHQGRASCFTFGKGFGIWLGILTALGLPYDEVTPQRWQGVVMDGGQRGKDASRMRAMALFPGLAEQLKLKSHDGRADALLIAEWRKRQG